MVKAVASAVAGLAVAASAGEPVAGLVVATAAPVARTVKVAHKAVEACAKHETLANNPLSHTCARVGYFLEIEYEFKQAGSKEGIAE